MRFDLFSNDLPIGVYIEKLIDMGYAVKQDKDYTIKWLTLDKSKDIVSIRKNLDIDITISESLITGNPLLVLKTKETRKRDRKRI